MSWLSAPIKSVAKVVTGNTPPKSDEKNYGGDVPWVKPPDLGTTEPIVFTAEMLSTVGAAKARLLPKDAVLVSCIGSIGRVGIAGTDLATNQQINAVICGSGLVPRFAMYWFMYSADMVVAAANKAVVPILNKGNFEKICIPVWPRSEQFRIVELLGEADWLRKLRRDADAKAARILPALFLKMFGDPATNPKGWPVKDFSQVFEDQTAGQAKVQARAFLPAGALPIIDQGKEQIAGYVDDTSIAYTGSLPAIAFGDHTRIFKFVDHPFALGAEGVRVLAAKDGFEPLFAYWHCRMLDIPSAGYSRHFKYLKEKKFVRPDGECQLAFARAAVAVEGSLESAGKASSAADALFSTLMQRAFSGQLTARWREAHMKELLIEMQEQARLLDLPMPETSVK